MTEHAVVVAGGGPTGMMLAAELAIAKIDVAIVERRATQALAGSRAGGLHSRTIEVLDQRGVADRFVSQGTIHPVAGYALNFLDMSDFPTRRNYVLGLTQNHIERIMAEWVAELGVPTYRSREVTGFTQDDSGVDVALANGETIRAQYLVGCDGGRSVIRKTAGIDFPGSDPTTSWLIAEVETTEEPAWGFRNDARGSHAIGRRGKDAPIGMVLTEPHLPTSATEPTLDDVKEALVAVYGTDFGIHSPIWISRFTDMTRQAATYRDRRVLLAGDAAHVHPPQGGQGLNIGVQDAVNLGWKLAQVVKGTSPDSLLDTYHAERHPAGARVLRNTMAQVALRRPDERAEALSDFVTELLKMNEPRRRIVGEISGLDVHYDLGEGHPLLGRRMPDLDLEIADGPVRVYSLLRDARPVLIELGARLDVELSPWADRLRVIDGSYEGEWELPVIGEVPAPHAVLIRPDGYVAWVGDGNAEGLVEALTTWVGSPATSPESETTR
jgi:3-(3-hydroxy-phenyl)propionate hydroxylase